MKNYKLFILALSGAFVLSSCGENKKEGKQDAAPTPMENDTRMESESASGNLDDGEVTGNPEFEDEGIAAVYQQYLELKSALVNSNAEETQSAGEDLADALRSVEGGEEALAPATEIAESGDLNVQRNSFSDLSAAVEDLVKGKLSSGEIYKQYCPMAFEGAGGYWLASSEEIRNPYYGDMMLKCGRVEETIK